MKRNGIPKLINIRDWTNNYLNPSHQDEFVNLAQVSPRNQIKLERVRRWLVHILRDVQFPSVERDTAANNLAYIGDPRPEVTTLDSTQFCFIPAGPFWMGDEDSYSSERPLHQVDVPYDYWISRYPITNAQFQVFVEAGGYQEQSFWVERSLWETLQIEVIKFS